MESAPSSDPLLRTLAAWRVAPTRNPQFRAAVWARLERGSAAPPWVVFARQHVVAVGGALVLAVTLGAVTGHGRARSRVAADSERLAAAYVQGLDARAMPPR